MNNAARRARQDRESMSCATRSGLEGGDVGTVVHVYQDGKALEVEFTTLDGNTAAVATVEAAAVRPVTANEITHSRELTRVS
jgi:uncharacterized protein DUF4926